MITTKLRKKNNRAFQTLEPATPGSKPLEWRLGMHPVHFTVDRIAVTRHHEVNDTGYELDEDASSGDGERRVVCSAVQACVQTHLRITGRAQTKDQFGTTGAFRPSQEPKDGIYQVTYPNVPISLTLRTGQEPPAPSTRFPKGAYDGHIFFFKDDETGETSLVLEMFIPVAQAETIAADLERHPDAKLAVLTNVLAFTDEVDDALREWYYPREMFIEDVSQAVVVRASVTVMQTAASSEEEQREEEPKEPPIEALPNPAGVNHVDLTPALLKLRLPLWIIAVALILLLLK